MSTTASSSTGACPIALRSSSVSAGSTPSWGDGGALDHDHVEETLGLTIVMHFMRRDLVKEAAEKSVDATAARRPGRRDAAVLSSNAGARVGFIPFAQAATHLLSVGRHHLIALAEQAKLVELSAGAARQLNEFQILNARRHVFFSPEDDLDEFVSGVRVERFASRKPAPARDSVP